MKKLISLLLALAMLVTLTAVSAAAEKTEFKIGICNFVKDASLDQIVENIKAQFDLIAEEKGVTFQILEDNCMADAAVMEQIIADFLAEEVDLMIGVATPVAMRMQTMTEGNGVPVIFSAVSDPVSAGLVETLEAPGANITGTSDFLNTNALLDLVFAANPDADKIGLLYDLGQDASTTPIADAKAYLDARGIAYVDATGTTTAEIQMAVESLIAAGVDAVFTPTDNTIMTAELAIYETLADAGIPHYCGADSFALNGAFVGYGVDYANLGRETANMAAQVLLEGADPASLAVMTFDNGTCTVNTETCEALGLDLSLIHI